MDPISAWAQATVAICGLIGKVIDGQTPEQRAQVWAWFIADQERLRKLLHIE